MQRWRWLKQQSPSAENRQAQDRGRAAFRNEIADLNRRIRDFNLKAPDAQVHLYPLRPETLLRKLERGA